MNSRGRYRSGGKLLIVVIFFTTTHAVALQMHPQLTLDLDFTRLNPSDPHVESWGDWKQTTSGLYASRELDEAGNTFDDLILSISRSRFEELYLDVVPTAKGRGKIEVDIGIGQGTHVQNIPNSPTPQRQVAGGAPPPEPAWNLRLAHYSDIFDVSGLVGDGGPVNLTSLWRGSGPILVPCRVPRLL